MLKAYNTAYDDTRLLDGYCMNKNKQTQHLKADLTCSVAGCRDALVCMAYLIQGGVGYHSIKEPR